MRVHYLLYSIVTKNCGISTTVSAGVFQTSDDSSILLYRSKNQGAISAQQRLGSMVKWTGYERNTVICSKTYFVSLDFQCRHRLIGQDIALSRQRLPVRVRLSILFRPLAQLVQSVCLTSKWSQVRFLQGLQKTKSSIDIRKRRVNNLH